MLEFPDRASRLCTIREQGSALFVSANRGGDGSEVRKVPSSNWRSIGLCQKSAMSSLTLVGYGTVRAPSVLAVRTNAAFVP